MVMGTCQLERRAERDQEEFESISRQLRKELQQFDRQRCRDFQSSIVVYLESLMNTQQQVIPHLLQCSCVFRSTIIKLASMSVRPFLMFIRPSVHMYVRTYIRSQKVSPI